MKRIKNYLSLLLALLMIITMVSGCSTTPPASQEPPAVQQPEQPEQPEEPDNEEQEPATQSYKAGTYSEKVYGYLSYLNVETTFSDTKITDIKITEHNGRRIYS